MNKEAIENLNESEMEGFIIDRSKSPQEIDNQTDRLEDKFRELEQKNSGSAVR